MSDLTLTLGKQLANAAAAKIPGVGPFAGPVVDSIFGSIFGGDKQPPSYFTEVYKRITSIVKQELAAEDIKHIDAAIHNVLQAIRDEYDPAKKSLDLKSKADRARLFGLLQKYDETFLSGPDGMLALLQKPEGKDAGLAVYIVGAGLRLTLYQEMAVVDPSTNAPSQWAKSPYGLEKDGTIALFAKEASAYVNAAYPRVLKQRQEAVTIESGHYAYQRVIKDSLSKNGAMVSGSSVINFIPENTIGYELAQEYEEMDPGYAVQHLLTDIPPTLQFLYPFARMNYISTGMTAELIAELGDPVGTAALWSQLIDTPVPGG